MKRVLALLVPALVAFSLFGGVAVAETITPIGQPFGGQLGLWKQTVNGADARVDKFFGTSGGSLRMTAGPNTGPTSGGQAVVSTFLGVLPQITQLIDIRELSYSVLATQSGSLMPTMQLSVDLDGGLPNWDTNLVFVPPTPEAPFDPYFPQPSEFKAWQWYDFNTVEGLWHSTQNVGTFMTKHTTLKTLAQVQEAYPGATVALIPSDVGGALRLQFGSSAGDAAGRVGYVDNFVIKAARQPRVGFNFDNLLPSVANAQLP